MSLAFLGPAADGAPPARSPMAAQAAAAGARFEVRDGWEVAVAVGDAERERAALAAVGFADVSHLGKLQVQAAPGDLAAIVAQAGDGAALEAGGAVRAAGAWWCAVTPDRALAVCDAGRTADLRRRLGDAAAAAPGTATVLDLTSAFAALTLAGPRARETFARFCALDLRPAVTPVGAFRPGSIARTPGMLVREDEERFLFWFGAALGQYLWTVVADAAGHLGGGPVGVDALGAPRAVEEAASHA